MIRAIRSKETGQWLTRDGKWTADLENARHFENITDANALARSSGVKDAEYVIRFGPDNSWDVVADIPSATRTPGPLPDWQGILDSHLRQN